MKRLFLFFLLVTSVTGFSQSRYQLKNLIQTYKDSVVLTATYPISSDSLFGLIEAYYVSKGWKLEKGGHRFSKTLKTRSRRDEPRAIQRGGISRTSRYVTCRSKSLVEVEVHKSNGNSDFNAKASLDVNYENWGWGCPNRPTYYRPKLDELSLRRYLYIRVYGDNLGLPSYLVQSIDKYNLEQNSERRLLIAGVDY